MKNQKLQFAGFGKPAEVLNLIEEAVPEPGAKQVLVEMHYAAINPSHLLTVLGKYGQLPGSFPATPGTEGAGIVKSAGEGSRWQEGDRVTFIPNAMGFNGTWQNFLVAGDDDLFATPEFLSDKDSGSIWINYLTAWVGLKEQINLKPGQVILLTACDSQLSRATAAMAKSLGAKVVGLSRRSDSALGDYDGIVSTDGIDTRDAKATRPELLKRLKENEITKNGIDHVFDSVGGPVGTALLNAMNDDGVFVVVGFLAGKPISVFAPIIFSQVRVQGFWITKWLARSTPELIQQRVDEVGELIAAGKIGDTTGRSFALTDYLSALDYLADNPRDGKVSFALGGNGGL